MSSRKKLLFIGFFVLLIFLTVIFFKNQIDSILVLEYEDIEVYQLINNKLVKINDDKLFLGYPSIIKVINLKGFKRDVVGDVFLTGLLNVNHETDLESRLFLKTDFVNLRKHSDEIIKELTFKFNTKDFKEGDYNIKISVLDDVDQKQLNIDKKVSLVRKEN